MAMSSPRGTNIQNSRLMDVIRALLLFECCGARSQLENAHIIIFQLARSGEIRVRDGLWGDPCAVLRGVGALFNGRWAGSGHSIRPGTLRYGVPQRERRKKSFLSEEYMRIASRMCAKIVIIARATVSFGNGTKSRSFASVEIQRRRRTSVAK